MLEDIARGLLYLHNQAPSNCPQRFNSKECAAYVTFCGKITDLGNSRIINLQPGQLAQTLSQNPGTLAYMPPELYETLLTMVLALISDHLFLFQLELR